MGLFTMSGNLVDQWEIPSRTETDEAYILINVAEAVKHKMEKTHCSAGSGWNQYGSSLIGQRKQNCAEMC